jgi:two-component system, NarL family, nitrate/nitrite response regulator NarL
MSPTIHVLVFEDEVFIRNRLRSLLSTANNIDLVGEVTKIQQLLACCRELQPHIVLIGGALKPFIFDFPAVIQQVSSQAKMIALLNQHDTLRTAALLATNLAGCLFRHELDEKLMHTIRAVAHGATSFSRAVMERMVTPQLTNQLPAEQKAPVTPIELTRREQEVLHLLAIGLSNKEMARALVISPKTIEFHIENIFKKLNVSSRVAAVLWAKAQHLFSD